MELQSSVATFTCNSPLELLSLSKVVFLLLGMCLEKIYRAVLTWLFFPLYFTKQIQITKCIFIKFTGHYELLCDWNWKYWFYILLSHGTILCGDMFRRYKLRSSFWIFFFISIKIFKGIWCSKKCFPNCLMKGYK